MKRVSQLIFILLLFLAWNNGVHASFGVSPPYVKTSKPIYVGGHFEQKITLLRSQAETLSQAKLTVNAPEIADWITIDKGEIFDLPVDQLKVPVIIRIDVPDNAEIGNYRGHINIRTMPKGDKGGGVAIALGARVEIDIVVTDEEFLSFEIKKVDISNFEIPEKPWNFGFFKYLFYKSQVVLKLKNTGNVEVAPSKIVFNVFDLSEKELLETSEVSKMTKILPFETGDILLNFKTELGIGQYWGEVKVYNDETVIHKDKQIFTVGNIGDYGGTKMGIWPYVLLSSIILSILAFIIILIKVRSWRAIYYFFLPLLFILRQLSFLSGGLKVKFFKWIHEKTSGYQDDNPRRRK